MGRYKSIIIDFLDAVYQFYNDHPDLTDIEIEDVMDTRSPYIDITFWSDACLIYKRFRYRDIEHMYAQLGYISTYEFEEMYKQLINYKNRKERQYVC